MPEQRFDFLKHLGLGKKKEDNKDVKPAVQPEVSTSTTVEKQSRAVDALMNEYSRLKKEALSLRAKNKIAEAITMLEQVEQYLNHALTIQNINEDKLNRDELDKIIDQYGANLSETTHNPEFGESNPSLAAAIREGKDKGKEINFNIQEQLKHWSDFYQASGIDWVTLPETISLAPDQIKEMTRLMEMGFDKLIIIPDNLIGESTITTDPKTKKSTAISNPRYEQLHQLMSKGYNETGTDSNYDADGKFQGSKDKTTKLRIVLTKDVQNLKDKDDELFQQTLGKSVDDLTNKDGLFARHQIHGLSESEYLIYQREYFQTNKKHLDEDGWTWLTESDRPLSGRVALARWDPGGGRLDFFSDARDFQHGLLGCRLAGSFEIVI